VNVQSQAILGLIQVGSGNSDEQSFGLLDNLEKCYHDLVYIARHCAALETLVAGREFGVFRDLCMVQ
jgi:hypothetical protein